MRTAVPQPRHYNSGDSIAAEAVAVDMKWLRYGGDISEDNFVCASKKDHRSACEGLKHYADVDGKQFCVLHYPNQDKVDDFNEVLQQKLKSVDFNFRGVYFPPDTVFIKDEFTNADFLSATFSGDVHFFVTKFNLETKFHQVNFSGSVHFVNAKFTSSVFFFLAKIEAGLYFSGEEGNPVFLESASLNFHMANITEPDRVKFQNVRLEPIWFANTDSRKFVFTNVVWDKIEQPSFWNYLKFVSGIEELQTEIPFRKIFGNPHQGLSNTYRQLATNYEENNRYAEAAKFRFASMNVERLGRWRGCNVITIDWWYWLVSGYGERIPRAAICLLVLLLSFSFLFTQVGFDLKTVTPNITAAQIIMPAPNQPVLEELPLPSFRDGLTYSLSAALFQRPEPKAHSFWAKLCVSLEMIFVPLQAALLALAVRRRFMR